MAASPPLLARVNDTQGLQAIRAAAVKVKAQRSLYERFQERYFYDPVRFARDCIAWPAGDALAPHQAEILQALIDHFRASYRGPHGIGKAQPYDLVIDTPTGRRSFGDLAVGDQVFGSDGQPTTVTGVYERGTLPVMKVIFNDRSHTYCSPDHLWTVRRGDWAGKDKTDWQTLPLSTILEGGVTKRNGSGHTRQWMIPTVAPLQYPYRWVPVDPYTLGAWLGDGGRLTATIHARDEEILQRVTTAGYATARKYDKDGTYIGFHILRTVQGDLRSLGVFECGSHDKFVPRVYLENIPEVRAEVLRGLLDTDGYIGASGSVGYTSVSKQLAEDVQWLVRSLGGQARTHVGQNDYGSVYNVFIALPPGRWFYVERKHERARLTTQKRYLHRWIDHLEDQGEQPVRCISVAAPDGLYVANDLIVTHNTATKAIAVLWFALTRDGKDWKIPTTASVWQQLTRYLWPEIHKWARLLRWEVIGRAPFRQGHELLDLALKLETGEAFAIASSDSERIEGAHADHLLYIFDEAKIIPDKTFDSAEGAFSSAVAELGREAYALAGSTPGEPVGRFYQIHRKAHGLEHWWTKHVTLEEAIATGRVSRQWADAQRRLWGESSALYQNRVLGQFAASDEDGVIPLSWVEAAVQRWRDFIDSGAPLPPFTCIGVDVANGGSAKNVFAPRHDNIIPELIHFRPSRVHDVMELTGFVGQYLAQHGGYAVIDGIGVGAGVVSRASERSYNVVPFIASGKSTARDKSGQLRMANCLTGDARVVPIGQLRRIYRARYDGPLFRIKMASGDDFTATPNHRVLTQHGWVRVQALNLGDKLYDAGFAARMIAADPEMNDVPPTISELYHAAAAVSPAQRVDAAGIDFHGDRPDGDVDVVAVGSQLFDGVPGFRQQLQDGDLIRLLHTTGDLPFSSSLLQHCFIRNSRASFTANQDRILPRTLPMASSSRSIGFRQLLSNQAVRCTVVSIRNPMLLQNILDCTTRSVKCANQRVQRYSGSIAIDDRLFVETGRSLRYGGFPLAMRTKTMLPQVSTDNRSIDVVQSHQATQGRAIPVSFDEVVSIEVDTSSPGHRDSFVYTLETTTGAYHTASVTHKNCRSEAWWRMRELLAPDSDEAIALPDDDLLLGDLTTPHWRMMSNGRVLIEAKEEIEKRIGRSTDDGDAVVMAYYVQNPDLTGAYGMLTCETCREPYHADPSGRPRSCPYCSGLARRWRPAGAA